MEVPRGSEGNRTVMDHDGNPLVVSAVLQYQIIDTYRAAIEIANIDELLHTQAEATLKHVVGQYPYDSASGTSLRRDVRAKSSLKPGSSLSLSPSFFSCPALFIF
jgi:regulator of protease activity HflC (stomatin/prohibitin superfamily)